MGFAPPTFEEFKNPNLLLARIRKQQFWHGFILGAGIIGFIAIIALVWVAR